MELPQPIFGLGKRDHSRTNAIYVLPKIKLWPQVFEPPPPLVRGLGKRIIYYSLATSGSEGKQSRYNIPL